jgi:membrane protease YdiL (CAAX protease family)
VTALSFGMAHTSMSMGFGQVEHDVRGKYLVGMAVGVAIAGAFFGFVVVELGSIWAAVALHATWNIVPVFSDVVPWLSLTTYMLMSLGIVAIAAMHRQAWNRLLAWLGVRRTSSSLVNGWSPPPPV